MIETRESNKADLTLQEWVFSQLEADREYSAIRFERVSQR
jgi:hypothetical protein